MQLYTNSIQDRYGNALKGAQITVRTDAGDIAALYSDNGVTVADNPLTADATGEFSFYAANGRYSFTVGAIGMQSEVVSAFEMMDALELQALAGASAAEAVANAAQVALDRAAVEAAVILADDDRTAAEIAAAQALTRSAAAALSEYNAGLSAAQVATSGTAATLAANLLLPGGGAMVGNAPAGTIAATTIQAAINELDAEKVAKTDVIAVAKGGTGATTANAAADALGAYRKGTLLGAVSQTAGVPTGAVIESGSNVNGEYVRWADGTQMCSGTIPTTAMPANETPSISVTLAAIFTAVSYSSAKATPGISGDYFGNVWVNEGLSVAVFVFKNGGTAQNAMSGRYVVFGRWF